MTPLNAPIPVHLSSPPIKSTPPTRPPLFSSTDKSKPDEVTLDPPPEDFDHVPERSVDCAVDFERALRARDRGVVVDVAGGGETACCVGVGCVCWVLQEEVVEVGCVEGVEV